MINLSDSRGPREIFMLIYSNVPKIYEVMSGSSPIMHKIGTGSIQINYCNIPVGIGLFFISFRKRIFNIERFVFIQVVL